jgi:hypothetical protein
MLLNPIALLSLEAIILLVNVIKALVLAKVTKFQVD